MNLALPTPGFFLGQRAAFRTRTKEPIMAASTTPALHVANPEVDDVPPMPADLKPTKSLPAIMPPRFAVDRGAGHGLEPLHGAADIDEARAQIKRQVTMGTSPIVYIYELVGAEMAVQASQSLSTEELEAYIKSNQTL